MKVTIKKRTLQATTILLFGMIVLQFVQPNFDAAPIAGDMIAPTEVKVILKRACYDCHSNETKLRWFDRISPFSWKIAQHIRDGRKALNFSGWSSLTPEVQKDKLWEAINHAMLGAMPLKEYKLLHPSAELQERDLSILKNYILDLTNLKTYDTLKNYEFFEQFNQWRRMTDTNNIPVAANGIAHDPDYKNWQAISTTDAFGNGTVRVIFGNTVAVKAINENRVNPWPKGTILAKVQWDQATKDDGVIQTGKFNQIEYMIKDDEKYADTEGWGWARFKTLDLIPDDKEVNFERKCISCHRPVKDLDLVFTFPIKMN
ncbi:hypothetical protein BH10BAC4_BH10BAC4_11510 [soil metagenome]